MWWTEFPIEDVKTRNDLKDLTIIIIIIIIIIITETIIIILKRRMIIRKYHNTSSSANIKSSTNKSQKETGIMHLKYGGSTNSKQLQ